MEYLSRVMTLHTPHQCGVFMKHLSESTVLWIEWLTFTVETHFGAMWKHGYKVLHCFQICKSTFLAVVRIVVSECTCCIFTGSFSMFPKFWDSPDKLFKSKIYILTYTGM